EITKIQNIGIIKEKNIMLVIIQRKLITLNHEKDKTSLLKTLLIEDLALMTITTVGDVMLDILEIIFTGIDNKRLNV
ncbi:MAG: hypothetical protein KAI44_10205, partial [Methylococcales bacterium]|nr:hypothetical protein [Methylococcales bacterium]